MNISGYKKRKIYKQSGSFSWAADMSFEDGEDVFFGFSGSAGNLTWRISGGKVLDQSGLLIGSVNRSREILFSGDVSSGYNDLYIDGVPCYLGRGKSSNNYDHLFFDVDVNNPVDINFYVNSLIPNWETSILDSFVSGETVEIKLKNKSNSPFVVFSGLSNDGNFPFFGPTNYTINAGHTGSLYLSSSGFFRESSFNVSLYTNFGDITFPFTASPITSDANPYFIDFGPNPSLIDASEEYNGALSFYNRSGARIYTTLEYVSGQTGAIYFDEFASHFINSGRVSGFISGSGTLTGYNTGIVEKYNDILRVFEYGPSGSGYFFQDFVATGVADQVVVIRVPAMGSGFISAEVMAMGFTNVTGQGLISREKKYIDVDGVTGMMTGYGADGTMFVSSGQGSGRINIDYDYDSIPVYVSLNENEYGERTYISDIFYGTGTFSRLVNVFGASFATGGRITGKIQGDFAKYYEPGLWTFSRYKEGSGSGEFFLLANFQPTTNNFGYGEAADVIYGDIGGIITSGVLIDNCEFELPDLNLTGIPTSYHDAFGNAVSLFSQSLITPNSTGERKLVDTSEFLINSGTFTGTIYDNVILAPPTNGGTGKTPSGSRIRISRLGDTPSGSGQFAHPFEDPFFTGYAGDDPSTFYGWKESLAAHEVTELLSGKAPEIEKISGELFFDGSHDSSFFEFEVTGLSNVVDLDISLPEYPNKKLCVNLTGSSYQGCLEGLPDYTVNYFYDPTYARGIYPDASYYNNPPPESERLCAGGGCLGTGDYIASYSSYDPLIDGLGPINKFGVAGIVYSRSRTIRKISTSYLISGTKYVFETRMRTGKKPYGISGDTTGVWSPFINFQNGETTYVDYQCGGVGCTGLGIYTGVVRYDISGIDYESTYSGYIYDTGNVLGNMHESSRKKIIRNAVYNGDSTKDGFRGIYPAFSDNYTGDDVFAYRRLTPASTSFAWDAANAYNGAFIGDPCVLDETGIFSGTYSGFNNNANGQYWEWGTFSGETVSGFIARGISSGYTYNRQCISLQEVNYDYGDACGDCSNFSGGFMGDGQSRINLSLGPIPSGRYTLKTYFSGCDRSEYVESLSFSHPYYHFCENDGVGVVHIQKNGDFSASGFVTVMPSGSNFPESHELTPSGFSSRLPFCLKRGESVVSIPFNIEDEGDNERLEVFSLWLRDSDVKISGNKGPVSMPIQRVYVDIQDDDINTVACSPTLPVEGFGCCSISGVCYDASEKVCSDFGGVFGGYDTMCLHNGCVAHPRAPINGACCLYDEDGFSNPHCYNTSMTLCEALGGSFDIETRCENIDCDIGAVWGACCNNGRCNQSTEEKCLYEWLGAGSSCVNCQDDGGDGDGDGGGDGGDGGGDGDGGDGDGGDGEGGDVGEGDGGEGGGGGGGEGGGDSDDDDDKIPKKDPGLPTLTLDLNEDTMKCYVWSVDAKPIQSATIYGNVSLSSTAETMPDRKFSGLWKVSIKWFSKGAIKTWTDWLMPGSGKDFSFGPVYGYPSSTNGSTKGTCFTYTATATKSWTAGASVTSNADTICMAPWCCDCYDGLPDNVTIIDVEGNEQTATRTSDCEWIYTDEDGCIYSIFKKDVNEDGIFRCSWFYRSPSGPLESYSDICGKSEEIEIPSPFPEYRD